MKTLLLPEVVVGLAVSLTFAGTIICGSMLVVWAMILLVFRTFVVVVAFMTALVLCIVKADRW